MDSHKEQFVKDLSDMNLDFIHAVRMYNKVVSDIIELREEVKGIMSRDEVSKYENSPLYKQVMAKAYSMVTGKDMRDLSNDGNAHQQRVSNSLGYSTWQWVISGYNISCELRDSFQKRDKLEHSIEKKEIEAEILKHYIYILKMLDKNLPPEFRKKP